MRVVFVTPVPPGSHKGNRITAERWARLVRQLGQRVAIEQEWTGQRCDVLVALHARKSHSSVARICRERSDVPVVLTLTGTDVYDEIHTSRAAQESLELADRLIVLQPRAIDELEKHLRPKARVIYQSCEPLSVRPKRRRDVFEVCVLGHLRPVKDPFRAAEAARLLPESSRIRVLHLGQALTEEMDERARREISENPRYRWLGDVPRGRALRLLARSRLLVLSSLLEGGANVIGEAVAAGTPVLASHIPGSIGLLGRKYPGYFPVGGTEALAELLQRAETDRRFYQRLVQACSQVRPLFRPARERAAWKALLAEVGSLKRSGR